MHLLNVKVTQYNHVTSAMKLTHILHTPLLKHFQ